MAASTRDGSSCPRMWPLWGNFGIHIEIRRTIARPETASGVVGMIKNEAIQPLQSLRALVPKVASHEPKA